MSHELVIEEVPYVGDADTIWLGHCTCKRWESGKQMAEETVRNHWADHRDAWQGRLLKEDVADYLGWSDGNHVAVAQKRTRERTASVPFPEPDGWHNLTKRRNAHDRVPWWREETIRRYAVKTADYGGRGRPVTEEQITRMRKLRGMGLTLEEIAEVVGVRKTTVSRHLRDTTEEE